MAVVEIPTQSEDDLRSAVDEFPELADVVDGIDAADAAVADVEARIVAGDDDVGLEDLEAAEKTSRLARLQARRAKAKAEREAEARRLARIDALRDELADEFPALHRDVLAEFDTARQAVADLVSVIDRHNARLSAVINELVTLGKLPADLDPRSGSTSGSSVIHVGDLQLHALDPTQFIGEAAWRAFDAIGSDAVGRFAHLGGVSHDRDTAKAYGVADLPSGAAGVVTPSIILHHKSAGLEAKA